MEAIAFLNQRSVSGGAKTAKKTLIRGFADSAVDKSVETRYFIGKDNTIGEGCEMLQRGTYQYIHT